MFSVVKIPELKEEFLSGDAIKINISGPSSFSVSKSDFSRISPYKWTKCYNGYIRRRYTENGKRITQTLHRFLIGEIPNGLKVDHINGDTTDNRRCNLRICTNSQNIQNGEAPNRTGFKGVFQTSAYRWVASIRINGKQKKVGSYVSPEKAAQCYDHYAKKHFGEFARTNFQEVLDHPPISDTSPNAPKGSRQGNSILKESDIPTIRLMLAKGESCINIGKKFGVSRQGITQIKSGRTWTHVS